MNLMDKAQRLADLVALSHRLGNPWLEAAILGEGNTSARATTETFYVKASGFQLPTIEAEGFTEVNFGKALSLLTAADISDQAVKDTLAAARVNPDSPHPSVETILHGLLLQLPDVEFVAHTHPVAVNAITCARNGERAFAGRLFPDEIVCCGPKYVWIPWTDPGAPLARKVHERVHRFVDEEGFPPKVILMQNHGMIALGPTVASVENATLMMVKTCKILLYTYLLGGPRTLSPEAADRICNRPDEKYRERLLERKD
jgi:rhamnose utilization protein RhaD (predicted bifunctional aldolase and dehydrogenase)